MTKYLITPSLINSFSYYQKDEWKSPADSRADFLRTLSREKFEPNESMIKGIQLEEHINQLTSNLPSTFNDKDQKYIGCVIAIANIVRGGIWQQSVKKELKIGDQEVLLYGRTDVIKADTIYDIKYTSKYDDAGKFQDSIQHLIYLFCTDLPKFSYLISDGKDWWREDYVNDNATENRIKSIISDFLGYLEIDLEAKKLFHNNWQSKY